MIASLSGILTLIGKSEIVLEVNGVGYLLNVSSKLITSLDEIGSELTLFTDLQIRDDKIVIYGFASSKDQNIFKLLQTVQGVGPRAALSILSTLNADELILAISSGDKVMISRADGVGPKVAGRITTELVEKVSRPATSITVPARVGTYLIKAVDKLGNFSSNATAVISNVVGVENFNNITTVNEHPTFAGTKTNVSLSDDAIILNSSELFDAASGNFDTNTTRFFDSGVANADFLASGNYEFENVIDIGAKHTARITASLTQSARNPDDLFDNRSGNFDSGKSNFDGDTPANCDAHLEIATSDDNSTFTSFQTFVIGNYTARYYKFRLVLTSSDLASTAVVSAVTVTVDMQDRIFSGNDIASGTSTKTVTFTTPFKTTGYAAVSYTHLTLPTNREV